MPSTEWIVSMATQGILEDLGKLQNLENPG